MWLRATNSDRSTETAGVAIGTALPVRITCAEAPVLGGLGASGSEPLAPSRSVSSACSRRLGGVDEQGATYEAAGVSLATADAVVERLAAAIESTRVPAVQGKLGGFSGLYALADGSLLAASTDGVGTKLVLARQAGRLRSAGEDLAAHCINDVSTTGADPLFLLDYVAAASIDLGEVLELVEGAATVCRAAGCALLGGETAELPGIYREGELDFAGTCVGLVQPGRLIDGGRCRPGDLVVGFPSSGLHANGFSLVRRLIGDEPFDADLLLPPTRLYLDDVRSLRGRADVRALAHVTGGGIKENLGRVLPPGVGARIDTNAWQRPRVYGWLAEMGIGEDELRRVFNLGIGMCAIVPARDAGSALVIGELDEGEGVRWAG